MDENAFIVQQLGKFADFFREYKGCPKGPVGLIGPTGGDDNEEIRLLVENLTVQNPIKDVDGNVWIPVNKTALDMALDALAELQRLRKIHHRFLEREKEAEEQNKRYLQGDPMGSRGTMGPAGW